MSGRRFLLDTNARLQHRLKLPDAIVVATAMIAMADLVSADAQLQNVPGVLIYSFVP
jgi:hypothetical protein